MAETINERLEDMVPELTDLEEKSILSRKEIRKVIEKRRSFEYKLISSPSVHDYLKYVEYETALDQLRRQRKHALGWKKRTLSDNTGIQRIIGIFDRALSGQYKADIKLWFQYLDFCLESGSVKQLDRVILKAVRIHPKEERFWILSADRHLRQFHLKAARTMLLRALRFIPNSVRIWQQYLKLECLVAQFAQNNSAPSVDDDAIEEKLESQLPAAPADSNALPSTACPSAGTKNATLDVLGLVVRRGCAQLGESGSSELLSYAHSAASDFARVADARHVESWTKFGQTVDEMRQCDSRTTKNGEDAPVDVSGFSLQVRQWSIDAPSAQEMIAACRKASVDATSAIPFLRALPSESRIDGFLEIAFRVDARSLRSITIQLLAFQLALSVEAYRTCIDRLTKELPKNPKSLSYGEHMLAIFDAILVTDTRLGTPGLEPLFDQVCDMEKTLHKLVDLWTRYEVYVEEQGGDSAKIRWRASRVVPAQALVERKLQLSQ